MASFVYILCGLTSFCCTVLLVRGYQRARVSLLFWSALAFLCFTMTNALLYIDLVMLPRLDLSHIRNLITLGGIVLLLYGLIHDS